MSKMESLSLKEKDIVDWINDLLHLRVARLDEIFNGAVACLLLDAVHPGCISLSRVNFLAALEADCLSNYKVVEDIFNLKNIKRSFNFYNILREKGEYLLEFMLWIKLYFDKEGSSIKCDDALTRRLLCSNNSSTLDVSLNSQARSSKIPRLLYGKSVTKEKKANIVINDIIPSSESKNDAISSEITQIKEVSNAPELVVNPKEECEGLRIENARWKMKIDSLSQEIQFYFSRLEMIESSILRYKGDIDQALLQKLQSIMYTTND